MLRSREKDCLGGIVDLIKYFINSYLFCAEYLIEEFRDILSSSTDDIFTQMFFQRLVSNENSVVFSAYEQDVEFFNVFVYDAGNHYSYYIPDELREIIKEELGF